MKKLISQLQNILTTTTLRKSSITFVGTVVNAIFGAIFYILAARILGPDSFGIMTIALSVLTLTFDMGDLGTDTGLVNFVSRYFNTEREKAYKFLKLGLKVKIYVWLVLFVLGVLASNFIANNIFLKPELNNSLMIAFLGVLSLLLFSFIIHALQAMQRFWGWSLIQVGTNFLRLILFILLFYVGITSVENTLWVYIAVPFAGFFIGLKMIGTKFLGVSNERSVSRDFFKYNKWVAAFAVVTAISSRMDTFITARLLDSAEVGIYSAANQMVKIVPQIVLALGTVIGPKMAELTDFKEFKSYLKNTQLLVVGLALLGVVAIPVIIFLIPYVFGNEYLASGPIFVILLSSMLIFLISVPVHTAVLYYYSVPKLFFVVGIIHLLIVIILGWKMTLEYGLRGAAYTVLIGQIFDFVVPLCYVLGRINRKK